MIKVKFGTCRRCIIPHNRVNDSEITIFKSNGLAIQDAATAKLVYDKAIEMKIGNEVDL